ncbi:Predicted SAM-depedendent methyltransferase [Bauldia litoralis]|uniref:Predicted SAM-depedendent methyltransferase n=2 Tax=Bauldia litoralis TaxID=665467 RepID=A0A1G6CVS6_9HYPH|nr:Predicted SAM-depedendent methyltransferase [Bauldia litoralis]
MEFIRTTPIATAAIVMMMVFLAVVVAIPDRVGAAQLFVGLAPLLLLGVIGSIVHDRFRKGVRKRLFRMERMAAGRALRMKGEIRKIRRKTAKLREAIRREREVRRTAQKALAATNKLVAEPGATKDHVQRDEGSLDAHIPAFLNAVRSVRAFGFELARAREEIRALSEANQRLDRLLADRGPEETIIDRLDQIPTELSKKADAVLIPKLWERIEFVRREMMYELKYRGDLSQAESSRPRSTAEPLLTTSGEKIRLNVGCGHIPIQGYINVDMRDLPGVDVVAPADALPVGPGTVAEIHSAHLIEHFPEEMLRRNLLPYWFSLLEPGGLLRAIVPDGDQMIRAAGAGTYGFEEFREVLFGAQEYEGDFHYNLLTPESATDLFTEAGFENVEIPIRGRRNGKCFEFEISAVKPVAEKHATDHGI